MSGLMAPIVFDGIRTSVVSN